MCRNINTNAVFFKTNFFIGLLSGRLKTTNFFSLGNSLAIFSLSATKNLQFVRRSEIYTTWKVFTFKMQSVTTTQITIYQFTTTKRNKQSNTVIRNSFGQTKFVRYDRVDFGTKFSSL
jgi:hypothetical protein